MTIQRMDHAGVVVDDLAAAIEFFAELGLELQGETPVAGEWVDRIVGLEGARSDPAAGRAADPRPRADHAVRRQFDFRVAARKPDAAAPSC